MIIEFTKNSLEGEPGPNFYWRGTSNEYLQLINDLHKLTTVSKMEFQLSKFKYLELLNVKEVLAKSFPSGNILCEFKDGNVLINLDMSIWREILHHFLNLSYSKCHSYIEFDNMNLKEDANFIISSE